MAGSDALEAAKLRLALAKKWQASSLRNLESAKSRVGCVESELALAKSHVKSAESEAASSREEVEESRRYLKSLEKKYQVIDVDFDAGVIDLEDDKNANSERGVDGKTLSNP